MSSISSMVGSMSDRIGLAHAGPIDSGLVNDDPDPGFHRGLPGNDSADVDPGFTLPGTRFPVDIDPGFTLPDPGDRHILLPTEPPRYQPLPTLPDSLLPQDPSRGGPKITIDRIDPKPTPAEVDAAREHRDQQRDIIRSMRSSVEEYSKAMADLDHLKSQGPFAFLFKNNELRAAQDKVNQIHGEIELTIADGDKAGLTPEHENGSFQEITEFRALTERYREIDKRR